MKVATFATLLAALCASGCCAMSRAFDNGSCHTCPAPLPAELVTVEKPCDLPPPVHLPGVTRAQCPGGEENLICYEIGEAAKIAAREMRLKDWVREVRTRCGAVPPASGAGPGESPGAVPPASGAGPGESPGADPTP